MAYDLPMVWSARRIPQLRGVARRAYGRMADSFLVLTAGLFLCIGCLTALLTGDAKAFFYCGLLCCACVVFALVVGGILAVFLGKTDSGYDYRLDADGLAVHMAGFSRLMSGVGAAAAATASPEKTGMAGMALTGLSHEISWTELAERGAAVEVVPAERVVILHEPRGRRTLLPQPPRAVYLFCESDERLAAVRTLIRQCLPGSVEKAAVPEPWRQPLRIVAISFMLAGAVGSVIL